MSAQNNTCELQRFNYDTQVWDTLQTRLTTHGGVTSDTFFDGTIPTNWGQAAYRILVTDNNGNAVGVSTLTAMAASR